MGTRAERTGRAHPAFGEQWRLWRRKPAGGESEDFRDRVLLLHDGGFLHEGHGGMRGRQTDHARGSYWERQWHHEGKGDLRGVARWQIAGAHAVFQKWRMD